VSVIQFNVVPVEETDHESNIVSKSDHVLISHTYPLNQIHVSLLAFRNKSIVHVLDTVQLIGENSVGAVGHRASRQIFLPVLTIFPPKSLTYPVYL